MAPATDQQLVLYNFKIAMLLAAVRNPEGLKHLDFTDFARERHFHAQPKHPVIKLVYDALLPRHAMLRCHYVEVPWRPSKRFAIDCKNLRIALTACPSPADLWAHLINPTTVKGDSGLKANVEVALQWALNLNIGDVQYIPPNNRLLQRRNQVTRAWEAILDQGDCKRIFVFRVPSPARIHRHFAYDLNEVECKSGNNNSRLKLLQFRNVWVGYHGSLFGSWASVLRYGLGKGEPEVRIGKRYADGVYASTNIGRAAYYSREVS